ncbi:hypothetical protein Agabi119p4_7250 [Agaricus bisporus var. burnettii]|uniref:Uncharacterized protein n=1 Tax=Agaricus bisporus var. burnettii TaxID=192524 RepID=A0A8H7EZ32_AGABI|nr:hypothetical protein Agabi119p4_7250 [Agaricus bisporus var. burnettii]
MTQRRHRNLLDAPDGPLPHSTSLIRVPSSSPIPNQHHFDGTTQPQRSIFKPHKRSSTVSELCASGFCHPDLRKSLMYSSRWDGLSRVTVT